MQKSSAALCFTPFQDSHSAVLGGLWGKVWLFYFHLILGKPLGKITCSLFFFLSFFKFPSEIKKFLMESFSCRIIWKEIQFSLSLTLFLITIQTSLRV